MGEDNDILYQTFLRTGREGFTLQLEVREALATLGRSYSAELREQLERGVQHGYVDQEDLRIAIGDGRGFWRARHNDSLYNLFRDKGRCPELEEAVQGDLDHLRNNHDPATVARLERGVQHGYVDADEFNRANWEGLCRTEQDIREMWGSDASSWDEDVSGYNGFLDGQENSDEDEGLCV